MLICKALSRVVEKYRHLNVGEFVLKKVIDCLQQSTIYIAAPNRILYQSTLPAGRKMKTLQILLFIAAVALLLLVGKHVTT